VIENWGMCQLELTMSEACCETSHEPKDTACKTFERGANGRCVHCDHAEQCHPGPGATCWIGRTANCSHCGGDRKIRCDDAECLICAMDDYCANATACAYCAPVHQRALAEFFATGRSPRAG